MISTETSLNPAIVEKKIRKHKTHYIPYSHSRSHSQASKHQTSTWSVVTYSQAIVSCFDSQLIALTLHCLHFLLMGHFVDSFALSRHSLLSHSVPVKTVELWLWCIHAENIPKFRLVKFITMHSQMISQNNIVSCVCIPLIFISCVHCTYQCNVWLFHFRQFHKI